MKAGKLSQTIWRRAVQKQLHIDQKELFLFPSQEENCAAIRGKDGQVVFSASAAVYGNAPQVGTYAVIKAVNDLASRGGTPTGVSVQFLLPSRIEEAQLAESICETEKICAEMGILLAGIQAEVSPAQRQTTIQVFVSGSAAESELRCLTGIVPGQEIFLCGYVGLEGTLRILDECKEELKERFAPVFLRQAAAQKKQLIRLPQLSFPAGSVTAIQQIGSGGILGALWEVAEAADVGLWLDMSAMCIRQETVEICEYYRLNPYQMTSAGSFLLITKDGELLQKKLEEMGIRAGKLGRTTAGRARVIRNGEEERFLDRPAPDELARWWEERLFI